MRARIALLTAAVGLAGGLAGCAPGPAGYAGAADYRQQQADQHAYLSNRAGQAAQWQAQSGDYWGARQSQGMASDQAAAANQEQAHANRDRWFSSW